MIETSDVNEEISRNKLMLTNISVILKGRV